MRKQELPILFLHGALGRSEDLAELMQLMRDKGHETHAFNFSGHGISSNWPSEFRIDLFARGLDKFFAQNGNKPMAVFGHSMGGYVALYHLAHFDSPIQNLVTYGTKFNWSEAGVAKELPMLNPDHLMEKFPHFAESLKAKHGDRWKQLLLSTAHMMRNLQRLDGLTREDLEDIEVPVTLVLGDQDRAVTREETNLTASWLHSHQVKVVSHSKHELERANLKEISEILADALT